VSAEPRPPRLALTTGDPAGVGPEVVLKALASPDRPAAPVIVYGPLAVLLDRAARFGLRPPQDLGARFVDVALDGPVELGRTSAAAGRAAAGAVLRAVAAAREGRVQALVTAPLNKESLNAAGHPWPGHTEMLAEAAGTPDVAMMFVGGGLRVALITIHRPLRTVPDAVTPAEVRRVIRLVHREMLVFGVTVPRIALCGLNPHAGEGGYLGREEIETIEPAIAAARATGLDVAGPLPADTVFVPAQLSNFDCVLAMYHDQGLPVLKHVSFGHGVNITLGLPILRTSVDHGTALDLAAHGKAARAADPGSLLAAVGLAIELSRRET